MTGRGVGPRARRAITLGAAVVAVAVLAGCRTTPPAPPTALSAYLPKAAQAYVYLDVPRAQGPTAHILEAAGIEEGDARRILERTERVAAAIGAGAPPAGRAGDRTADRAPGQSGAFLLAASGRFPGFLIEATLEDDEEWQPRRVRNAGGRFRVWHREADGLELSFPEPRLVLAGIGGLEAALRLEDPGPTPGAAAADAHVAALAVPRTRMRTPFGGAIEVRDVLLLADPAESPAGSGRVDAAWRIGGELELPDEDSARAVTALVRLFAISTIAETGADPGEAAEGLVVERDGRRVTLDGIVLGEADLLDALDQFLRESGGAGL